MAVDLSAELQRLIEERVKRGDYASADDVVRAGLASLEQQEAVGDFDAGELDALLADGEQSGAPLDGERVLAELAALRELRSGRGAKIAKKTLRIQLFFCSWRPWHLGVHPFC